MKTKKALALSTAFFSLQVWAFPLDNCGCDSTIYERGMQDLSRYIHKAAIIGDVDGRVPLSEIALERKWSEKKLNQAMHAVGRIKCLMEKKPVVRTADNTDTPTPGRGPASTSPKRA